ncbi:MAG: hypothetical protein U9P07_01010 [Pseudomonadota bacterium]|nr:hypothetical protein [Pseudomonadota bacterium]
MNLFLTSLLKLPDTSISGKVVTLSDEPLSGIPPPCPQPDPAAVQVEAGAAPGVMITPTIQVPAADIGNSGQLLLYIYMPSSVNFGINIPGRTVTLEK